MADGYCVGVDLGGTNIQAGLLDVSANVKCSFSVPAEVDRGAERVIANITATAERAITDAGVERREVVGIGVSSRSVIPLIADHKIPCI